ncbi:MAG TPA: histidine phosphatase family protein [Spirochaetota bacterium]|nr:histidine phosphatase family protein [Spirochaetota bacterium]
MGEITFIRHGQASFGKGDYDVLSEKGRDQSAIMARYLADCGMEFGAAYSGTLKRQKDTADIILQVMDSSGSVKVPQLVENEGFNEYHSDEIMRYYVPIVAAEDAAMIPLLEKIFTDRKSFQLIFERVISKWVAGESPSDGVEGWSRFRQRVDESLKSIINANGKDGNIVVFSSGGVISASVQIATGMSPFEAMRLGWGLVNCSLTRFRYGSSGLIVHSFNNYAHFEMNNLREFITYR